MRLLGIVVALSFLLSPALAGEGVAAEPNKVETALAVNLQEPGGQSFGSLPLEDQIASLEKVYVVEKPAPKEPNKIWGMFTKVVASPFRVVGAVLDIGNAGVNGVSNALTGTAVTAKAKTDGAAELIEQP